MSWKDDLLAASFRGAAFFVESTDAEVGRRTDTQEFPGRDKGVNEDNGRRMRRFTFDAFVIGNDYMLARDELLRALEEAGPGRLVHPTWGELDVSVDGPAHIKEAPTTEGGIARITLSFVEEGDDQVPVVRVSTPETVRAACDEVEAASAANFAETFNLLDVVQSVIDAALDAIDQVLDAVAEAAAFAQAVLDAIDAVTEAIENIKESIANLIALPGNLVQSLSNSLTSLVEALFSAVGGDDTAAADATTTDATGASPRSRVDVLTSLVDQLSDLVPQSAAPEVVTPTVEQQASNDATLSEHVSVAVAASAVRASSFLSFDSYDQAAALRDKLGAVLDGLLARTSDDALYASLASLRSAMVSHLKAAATALPRIVEYTPPATAPALVVAYRLYGDATREAEIVARNRIRHPGFVGGGVALQVVSRA